MPSKFLVLWMLELNRVSPDTVQTILRQQDYGARLESERKVTARYHLVGSHGGAWIYEVDSNEELDTLLAQAPVYNVARYQVHALAEMRGPTPLGTAESE